MTGLIDLALKVGPWILGLLGILFGVFRNQQAAKTEAQARQAKAEADAHVAQVDATQSKANEVAARAGADNAKVRRNEDAEAAVVPDANRVLHDEWGK